MAGLDGRAPFLGTYLGTGVGAEKQPLRHREGFRGHPRNPAPLLSVPCQTAPPDARPAGAPTQQAGQLSVLPFNASLTVGMVPDPASEGLHLPR